MNAERFTFYIKNPAHLYQITYTELKSLVLQYPYCQNLRYLLLKKSILENHKELDQNLQLAATFSTDRDYLYRQIKDGESYVSEADSFLLKEDYLELKELRSDTSPDTPEETGAIVKTDVSEEREQNNPADEPLEPVELPSSPETHVNPPVLETESPPALSAEEEDLSTIEEEDFEDITDEIKDLFEEEPLAEEAPLTNTNIPEEAEKPEEPEPEQTDQPESRADEAISIEELIALDNMTPLERMEKIRMQRKSLENKPIEKTNTNEEPLEDLKKKTFDFSDLDELIEQTKKDIHVEITNDDFLEVTKEEKANQPSPKTTFGSWLKQFQSSEPIPDPEEKLDLLDNKKASKPKKKKKKKKTSEKTRKENNANSSKGKKKNKISEVTSGTNKPKRIAEKSLKENEEIVSETLAALLVKQENYKKAIKMYEKLILIFPEKSSFFAEQIKKLKNL